MSDEFDEDEIQSTSTPRGSLASTAEPVDTVKAVNQTKPIAMPKDLQVLVDQMNTIQKRYAEFRSKGLKQSDAAQKAGSKASGRAALGRVGYQWEQLPGMKEYISFLYEKRARASVVDEIEIIEKLRANYELAIENGRIDHANKAVELMGMMIGAFKTNQTKEVKEVAKGGPKNNIDAFKNEGEETTQDDRVKRINNLMKTVKIVKEGD